MNSKNQELTGNALYVVCLLYTSITEDGSPVVAFRCGEIYPSDTLLPNTNLFAGNAHPNMQSNAKTTYTKEQKIVQLSAVLLFDVDIAPDSPTLSACFVVLDGVKRNIVQGIKPVSYTHLIKQMLLDLCVVGDGAFKVSFDTAVSDVPIVEWYPCLLYTSGEDKSLVIYACR